MDGTLASPFAERAGVDLAVLGANRLDCDRVNGLASDLEDLGAWVGSRGVQHELTWETDEAGLVTSTTQTYTVSRGEGTKISRKLNAVAVSQPSIRTDGASGSTTLEDHARIVTRVRDRRELGEHLDVHRGVRDLVSLSSWSLARFQNREVLQDRDGSLMGDNRLIPTWFPTEGRVINAECNQPAGRRNRQHLIKFSDLGSAGVDRWLRLRESFARGMDPILSLLFTNKTTTMADMAQLGIGLEGLGYALALKSGASRRAAKEETFAPRVARLVKDTPVLPSGLDRATWPEHAARVYNGVKHANRELPDLLEMANIIREGSLLFRLWVASSLGVEPEALSERLARDPQNEPWR